MYNHIIPIPHCQSRFLRNFEESHYWRNMCVASLGQWRVNTNGNHVDPFIRMQDWHRRGPHMEPTITTAREYFHSQQTFMNLKIKLATLPLSPWYFLNHCLLNSKPWPNGNPKSCAILKLKIRKKQNVQQNFAINVSLHLLHWGDDKHVILLKTNTIKNNKWHKTKSKPLREIPLVLPQIAWGTESRPVK